MGCMIIGCVEMVQCTLRRLGFLVLAWVGDGAIKKMSCKVSFLFCVGDYIYIYILLVGKYMLLFELVFLVMDADQEIWGGPGN